MFEYKSKSNRQLRNDYNRRNRNKNNSFRDFDDFKNWYHSHKKVCVYCDIKEEDCQKIVVLGLLKSSRFPKNGKTYRGKARGMWLEVDRKDPGKNIQRIIVFWPVISVIMIKAMSLLLRIISCSEKIDYSF
jgi:hypothetical protein